ncbi:hypothetical protein GWI72_07210 [Microvirga tunisiensis]|uniref:Uncharacterized protein n=1 Tax=Pannonibacter tanglangensis TaxID=2750084 RepID=A0A7X5F1J2_9HYPH|nr:hypothetical protein [Pannonibacter sp. XCT-53]NBN78052.1 hypothetical protein [Pannonibacter sp. XCT-53]
MRNTNLWYNLKAAKRSLKEVPETLRLMLGAVTRTFGGAADLPDVGSECPAPSRAYRPDSTPVPIHVVTPSDGHYMTTFFDIDPLSPSGRYLAVTRVPFIWRVPTVGEAASVVVIDLHTGHARTVYRTVGWGAQLGANVQWGADDATLLCNDVIDGRGTGVRIDLRTLTAIPLSGPVYGLTPDRRTSFSARIDYINAGIPGYGVPDPVFGKPRPSERQSKTDGIWRTDLETGASELFLSIDDIVRQLPEQESLAGGTYYVFNVKISPTGTQGFAVLFSRGIPGRAGWPPQLVTFDLDGTNVRLAIPDRIWRRGGHHPSWLPWGDEIVMNLRHDSKKMQFVRFRPDGTDLNVLAPGHVGGGHPSLNQSGTHLLTDAYVSEKLANDKGEVPIRLIDLRTNVETALCHVDTKRLDGWRRIDPHPVWSDRGKKVFFNGIVDGRRQVLCADMSNIS